MNEILSCQDIRTGVSSLTKEEAIEQLGQMLYGKGCCTRAYIQAMHDKEKVFNTYIGNDLALPHGIESARDEVLHTGLAVLTCPEGIDWGNGMKARLIIGIAAKDDEQVEILSRIAVLCMDPDNVKKLVESSPSTIHRAICERF